MATYTKKQIKEIISKIDKICEVADERDNAGQIVLYTGIFEHSDGKFYDEPEEEQ